MLNPTELLSRFSQFHPTPVYYASFQGTQELLTTTILVNCRKHCHFQIKCKVSFSHISPRRKNDFHCCHCFHSMSLSSGFSLHLWPGSDYTVGPHNSATHSATPTCRLGSYEPSVLSCTTHCPASELLSSWETHTKVCSCPPNPNKFRFTGQLSCKSSVPERGTEESMGAFSFSEIPMSWQNAQDTLILQALFPVRTWS